MKDNLLNCLRNYHVRYASFPDTIFKWFVNRKKEYQLIEIRDLIDQKKSDTIFILGGSESINDISTDQWETISKHDSFGMNWWPMHWFIPTYYQTAYPTNRYAFGKMIELLTKRSDDYIDTVLFIRDRSVKQGIHPRIFPELFNTKKICLYKYPALIRRTHNLTKDDFKKGFILRGQLNLALYLAIQMQYKKIVLLGIEWKNRVHFYNTYPEAAWMVEKGYAAPVKELRENKHMTDISSGNKPGITYYLRCLKKFVLDEGGIELYIQKKDNPLYPLFNVYNLNENVDIF